MAGVASWAAAHAIRGSAIPAEIHAARCIQLRRVHARAPLFPRIMWVLVFFIHSSPFRPRLEDFFDCELDLARGGSGSVEQSRRVRELPCTIENVRVGGGGRRSKVSVVENVEDLRAELHIELLGNPLDVTVLE